MDKFQDIEKAKIKIMGKNGQGVYVGNNLFLTAAHCINFKTSGSMVLGDHFIEDIEIQGQRFRVAPWAIEPISDIAVLGPLDDQVFPDDADRLENFCEDLNPVLINTVEPELFQDFEIHVFNHEGGQVSGKGQVCSPGSKSLFIETKDEIKGGTSGGPIVDESGGLVGIVSNFSGNDNTGVHPRPHLTLPLWVLRKLEGAAL
jgi:hypothetical protein